MNGKLVLVCRSCGRALGVQELDKLRTPAGELLRKRDRVKCSCGWVTFWRPSRLTLVQVEPEWSIDAGERAV